MQPLARASFALDPGLIYLNHGAFGATPRPVLEAQGELRARLERNPTQFFDRDLEALLAASRAALAPRLGADADDLAFVANATHGVNTVLRSLDFAPGDELLTTDHAYNACRNALDARAAACGARVVVAACPFPLQEPEALAAPILAAVTARTKLALLDHVTSPTGLIFPIAGLVAALEARGVATLIDGAHAPGMVPIDLRRLGASYYTGNCHKWLCTPKGCAFLVVRRDRQSGIRPLAISHGANAKLMGRSRFQVEFDWTGTADPTAALVLPQALSFLDGLLPGGLEALQARNHALAMAAQGLLAETLGVKRPAPESCIGALAAVPLPDEFPGADGRHPLQGQLLADAGIEVPIFTWPVAPRRLLRISAQAYNGSADYQKLAAALRSANLSTSR